MISHKSSLLPTTGCLVIFMLLKLTACGGSSNSSETEASADSAAGLSTNAKTLEICNADALAWVAVVDNGAKPASCGNPLASWCCSRPEVLARFPKRSTDLEEVFKSNIDDNGYKLYNCSKNGPLATELHFGKITADGKTVSYKVTTIDKLAETEPSSTPSVLPQACTKLTTADLKDPLPTPSVSPTSSLSSTPSPSPTQSAALFTPSTSSSPAVPLQR